jgi:hypothetical protein
MRLPVSVRVTQRDKWHRLEHEKREGFVTRIADVVATGALNGAASNAGGDPPDKPLGSRIASNFSAMLDGPQITKIKDILNEFDPRFDLDPIIAAADVWPSNAPGGGVFGERRHAADLLRLPRPPAADAGAGVNVVIIDHGLQRDRFRRWRQVLTKRDEPIEGGWARYQMQPGGAREWFKPGRGPDDPRMDHADMIARNVLMVAPAATIWDVPILPDTLLGPSRIAIAEAIYWHIYSDLTKKNGAGTRPAFEAAKTGPWILVNAWSARDRHLLAQSLPGEVKDYFENKHHRFVEDMKRLSDALERPFEGKEPRCIDVVFSAGNAGVPGGDPLSGKDASGPGRSIHGVNAHANVLTVGAVRADGVPIGLSAQGPGRLWQSTDGIAGKDGDCFHNKPDICCPSHFREDEDGHLVNTGTSAACGIAAGMLAALRGIEWAAKKDQSKLTSPQQMRALLRGSAHLSEWHPRLGWGIPDFEKARAALGV